MRLFVYKAIGILLLVLLPSAMKAQQDDEARRRKLSYFYMAAQRAKAQERYADMLEMLEHCRDIAPDDPATTFELGEFGFYLGKDSVGMAMLEQAVSADPGNPWYLERLATAYLSQRKQDKALEILEKMASLQTKRVDVLSQLFMLYKQMGRTEDVIRTLDRIQTLQGNSLHIAEQKFQLYRDMDQQDMAFSQMRAVCKEFPYDVNCHLVTAEHYMEDGQMDSAMVCLDRAERIDPQHGGLLLLRLRSVLERGDTLAYEHQRDSLILDDQTEMQVRFTALREIALTALQDSTKQHTAKVLFDKLLASKEVEVPFLQLYKSYDAYQHQDDAKYINLPLVQRILEAEPSNFETQSELVQYYISQNDQTHLQEACRNALVYFPSEVRFHYFLAITYFQDNQLKEAEETLKAGIRQADEATPPEMVGTLYSMLGDVYHSTGREAEAFAAYDSCLVYAPDEVSCLNNYAYYLSLKNQQLDKAEQMSYRAVKLQPDSKTYIDTYAWVLFMQEDYTTARMYMDRVVDPEASDSTLMADEEVNPVLLEHAGDIYAQCGLLEQAMRFWKLALDKAVVAKEPVPPVLKKKLKKGRYMRK